MRYSTPELVVLGPASVLVLGIKPGMYDNDVSLTSRPASGVMLGFDE